MTLEFKPCTLHGEIDAPPSKSMAHRYLIGAALSGHKCTLYGVDFSEDILASIDCLRALGAKVTVTDSGEVTVDQGGFMKAESPVLECRESGSTLRFFIPLALCLGKKVTLRGSERLFERPLGLYEELCSEKGFIFEKGKNSVTVCGSLKSGSYKLRGDVSSQFITGLLLALAYLGDSSKVEIIPPFESRSYIGLTLSALNSFGFDVAYTDRYVIEARPSEKHSFSGRIEGDYSNAAFLDAFNCIGSDVKVGNLSEDSLQGDRAYKEYFKMIESGAPTLDISDCPDLGPILIALAALLSGATFTGTERLKAKESDRGAAMHEELKKLGGGLIFGDNSITVPRQTLKFRGEEICGHNDHRIVMAMSVILTKTGGVISGAEAVRKSYPGFFEDIRQLQAEVKTV